jgi:hypothetical protein
MEKLMEFNVALLITQTLIIAVCTLGWVQWLKNFICPANKKWYAVISLLVTIICVVMNSEYIPDWIIYFWNSIALCNAVVQLAYEAVVSGLQNLISKAMGSTVQEISKQEGKK